MTFESGKAVYKDLLEEGMLRRLEEVNPIQACELRIERLKRSLEEEETKLANYRLLDQMSKTETKRQTKNVDPSLERLRLEKFEKWKESLAIQVSNGKIDWKTNMTIFLFDSLSETREWVLSKLKEADLLD
ncbi:predicted protein [Methanosarcina acetivorans C2A]|uniref:Uncharacterized protein n=2 Tax=Methanosarcina acetivorans TaxID=2214 RepID=Q8TJF5_METAC|nr:predicted protein [Methanosarcina acetivorans C2A]